MRSIRIPCCAAVLLASTAACEKNSEPKEGTSPETVTQSVKPAEGKLEEVKSATAKVEPMAVAKDATLKVGDPAPAVSLTLQDGKSVALSSLAGKQVAVYFYPKDDTAGCTVEAQGIRDQWKAFETAGVAVYGVSMQDAASHQAFIAKNELPFNLVVDDGSVTKAFGVPVKGGQYAARQTFLIGADGKIKQIWREVDPNKHAGELLQAATAAAAPTPATAEPAAPAEAPTAEKKSGEPG